MQLLSRTAQSVINLGGPGSGRHPGGGATHVYTGDSQQFKSGDKGFMTNNSGRSAWFSTEAPGGSGAYIHPSEATEISGNSGGIGSMKSGRGSLAEKANNLPAHESAQSYHNNMASTAEHYGNSGAAQLHQNAAKLHGDAVGAVMSGSSLANREVKSSIAQNASKDANRSFSL